MSDAIVPIAATDLGILVNKGFPEYLVRYALKVTHGDRHAASQLLVKLRDYVLPENQVGAEARTWRGESEDDWINYIPLSNLPSLAQSRGLWKSPIYASITHTTTSEDKDVQYHINITLKDGRSWSIVRLYTDFVSFRASLPSSMYTFLYLFCHLKY